MSNGDAATRASVGDVVGTSCIPGAPGHSTSSRLGRCKWMCAVLAIVALCSVASGAKIPERVLRDSLVKVELGEGEKCFVLSSDFLPVDLAKTKDGVVFTGKPGRYAVVVSVSGEPEQPKFVEIFDSVPVPVPPAPIPPGPVPPGPTPQPAPVQEPGLHVLIVYETSQVSALPAAQRAILQSTLLMNWMNANCAKVDGRPEWRFTDQNTPVQFATPFYQSAMTRPRTSIPWVIIANGTKNTGFEGVLPANVDDMLKLLEAHR